jgi:hypothetical protein
MALAISLLQATGSVVPHKSTAPIKRDAYGANGDGRTACDSCGLVLGADSPGARHQELKT